MTHRQRVVFFGSGPLAAHALQTLLSLPDLEVVAVVTAPLPQRAPKLTPPVIEVATVAELPILQPVDIRAASDQLVSLQAEAGVLFAYGKILPESILHLFPRGIVNIHPSLLPKHRGPSPIEATILNGDTIAGTTLMVINKVMDAGPIIAQDGFFISNTILKAELTSQLLATADHLLQEHLIHYINGQPPQSSQHPWREASYCGLIKKSDGDVQLKTETATSLDRKVRAYAGWPQVRIAIRQHGRTSALTLHAVRPVDVPGMDSDFGLHDNQLIAQTGLGQVVLETVQLPGKQPITGQDLIHSGPIETVRD